MVVASHPDRYEVQLERVMVNESPNWIARDIRSEVFHDAGWHEQPLSISEDDLTVRVAQAFEQHTWVAKVTRVTKQPPATVSVELKYRCPVAMVEVDSPGQGGLLPVDAEGVLLPPEDFDAEHALTYPRITVDYSGPSGSVGTPWGDERVESAAKIAAALVDRWASLGLYRVVALPSNQPASVSPPTYELHTRGSSRVLWGHAPGAEQVGEATAEQKAARLLHHVQQNGSFDKRDSEVEVDLRAAQDLTARVLEDAALR